MRTALTTIMLLVLACQAMAIQNVTSTSLSCQAIHSIVKKNRSVLLRYSSASGLPIYDKVIADGDQCFGSGAPETSYFPAADTRSCPVLVCVPVSSRRP